MKKLKLIRIHTTETDYDYCEDLYIKAFPPAERRDEKHQRILTDTEDRLHFCAISLEDETVGFLTYWNLGSFLYIEHFAIDPAMRGLHIGSEVLHHLHENISLPLILEVERPDTDIARRRIAFYERCGYILWKSHYLQPPYQKGQNPLPLYLMCHGSLKEETDFAAIKDTLYREVYRYQLPERSVNQ